MFSKITMSLISSDYSHHAVGGDTDLLFLSSSTGYVWLLWAKIYGLDNGLKLCITVHFAFDRLVLWTLIDNNFILIFSLKLF